MAAKISVQKSRFALLKVEDSDDAEDNASQDKKPLKPLQPQANAKKKNKKKKKTDDQGDAEELKHMAFGQPSHKHKHGDGRASSAKGKTPNDKQWEEWKKLDSEYAAEAFEKDLQQALLSSKLEYEHTAQLKKAPQPNDTVAKTNGEGKDGKKKKKKKDKLPTMSLEQFNQMDTTPQRTRSQSSDEEAESPPPPPPQTRVPEAEADPMFFDKVQADVNKILIQEKMQEEYKKQYAIESVLVRKYEDDARKKDKEVTMLRATVKKLEEELKQVKQRNKQLCHILGQGEMKDKAEVLMQIDQLSQVKDELTEQVTSLTADLEKERSKVNGFKSELDRMKGAKHGGK